ncbi:E3 ubiquitin-protein ligase AMFR [Pelomyxa schiedti]|nr:E3 ubiquitin-protein ligase AMFR [Pelomyxa schiedti]
MPLYFVVSFSLWALVAGWSLYSVPRSQLLEFWTSFPAVMVAINSMYAYLLLTGRIAIRLLYGRLRVSESKHLKEQTSSHVMLKVGFLGLLANSLPQYGNIISAVVFGCSEFISAFTLLSKERAEYIRLAHPNEESHKMDYILIALMLMDILLFCVVFSTCSGSLLVLVSFECFTLCCKILQPLLQSVIAIIERQHDGIWEQRGAYSYYADLVLELGFLVATLGYYMYIVTIRGVSFSIMDICMFTHIGKVSYSLKKRLTSFKNYLHLVEKINTMYPIISGPEVASDLCPICQDQMTSACKLPCTHLFHRTCLMRWLESDHTCPTCRRPLLGNHPVDTPPQRMENAPIDQAAAPITAGPAAPAPAPRTVWEWRGGGWLNFLPPFSVQLMRNNSQRQFRPTHAYPVTQEMIQRIAEVFPHIPTHIIVADLQQTGSIEATTENLINGVIGDFAPPPPDAPMVHPSPIPAPHSPPASHPHSSESTTPSSAAATTNTTTTSSTSTPSTTHTALSTASSAAASPSPQQSPSSPLSEPHPIFKDSFAATAHERQEAFAARQRAIMEAARRRYLDAKKTQSST